MQQDYPPDAEVAGWLRILGVESLCQWDVLIFLHRHQTSLVGAEYLAGLLGYPVEPVVTALDALTSLGLLARSRISQGARYYVFTAPPEPPRSEAFERLLALVSDRAGRLRLAELLRSEHLPGGGAEATRRFHEGALRIVRGKRSRSRDRDKRSGTWRKII
jgi:hypothetical protein